VRRAASGRLAALRRWIYRSIVPVPSLVFSRLRTTLSQRRHFIRIQAAEVNATKRLLRGAGWRAGTQASLRSAGSWERLLEALSVAPELQGHIRLHRAVWQQAGEQVRALDHLLGELARDWRDEMRRLEAVPASAPSWPYPPSPSLLTCIASPVPSGWPATPGSCRARINPAPPTGTVISPSAGPPNSARCSARRRITPVAHPIRSTRTSPSGVPGAD